MRPTWKMVAKKQEEIDQLREEKRVLEEQRTYQIKRDKWRNQAIEHHKKNERPEPKRGGWRLGS